MRSSTALIFLTALILLIMGGTLYDTGVLNLLDYVFVPYQPINWSHSLAW